eukprot:249237-Amorphochlora_amoeboformis.AAC.1
MSESKTNNALKRLKAICGHVFTKENKYAQELIATAVRLHFLRVCRNRRADICVYSCAFDTTESDEYWRQNPVSYGDRMLVCVKSRGLVCVNVLCGRRGMIEGTRNVARCGVDSLGVCRMLILFISPFAAADRDAWKGHPSC